MKKIQCRTALLVVMMIAFGVLSAAMAEETLDGFIEETFVETADTFEEDFFESVPDALESRSAYLTDAVMFDGRPSNALQAYKAVLTGTKASRNKVILEWSAQTYDPGKDSYVDTVLRSSDRQLKGVKWYLYQVNEMTGTTKQIKKMSVAEDTATISLQKPGYYSFYIRLEKVSKSEGELYGYVSNEVTVHVASEGEWKKITNLKAGVTGEIDSAGKERNSAYFTAIGKESPDGYMVDVLVNNAKKISEAIVALDMEQKSAIAAGKAVKITLADVIKVYVGEASLDLSAKKTKVTFKVTPVKFTYDEAGNISTWQDGRYVVREAGKVATASATVKNNENRKVSSLTAWQEDNAYIRVTWEYPYTAASFTVTNGKTDAQIYEAGKSYTEYGPTQFVQDGTTYSALIRLKAGATNTIKVTPNGGKATSAKVKIKLLSAQHIIDPELTDGQKLSWKSYSGAAQSFQINLNGEAIETVNGSTGVFSTASDIEMDPGANSIVIVAFAKPDGEGAVVARSVVTAYVD